jgi:hypothetical protein
MSQIKKLNRNSFNEKLIHRYLFERYYFGNKSLRNSLLPKTYHKLEIKLIAPEVNSSTSNYRADLSIYFKQNPKKIPVEVKWSFSELTKQNQIQYLEKNNGFVVSFDKNKNSKLTIPQISINYEDFFQWVSLNVSNLTRESLSYRANIDEINANTQYWLVFLRGTAHPNFQRMLSQSSNSPFWAYEQNKTALKNIFDVQKNDLCIYILGKANEGMGVSDNPNLPLEINSYYTTKIKEPYYMVLKGKKGTFFEKGDIPINKRRWPHFVDFYITSKFEKKIILNKRGEFSKCFAESYNYGHGTPVSLTRRQWDSLQDLLRSTK